MFTDFENFNVFKPASQHEKSVNAIFDQVILLLYVLGCGGIVGLRLN